MRAQEEASPAITDDQPAPTTPDTPTAPDAPTVPTAPDADATPPSPDTAATPSLPILEPPLPGSPDAVLEAAPDPGTPLVPVLPDLGPGPITPSGGLTPGITGEAGALPAGGTVAGPAAATERRFRYAFRFSLGATYDDNVFLQGSQKRGDVYFSIEPGVTAGFGDVVGRGANYVRLDYAPTVQLYSQYSEANNVQHLIRVEGQYFFGRLTAAASQDVQLLDGSDLNVTTNTGTTVNRVNLDVSARTKVNIYVSRLAFTYSLSQKSALALTLLYNNNDYESLISSQTFSGDFSYNYAFSSKLNLGLALSAGYLKPQQPDPNQTYEQISLRAAYQTTGKVSVTASVGLEVRQFEGSSSNHVTPVLEIGALYQPFDGTLVTLSASRRVLSSATLAGQDYTTTGFTITGRQRFLRRYFPTLTLGYENSSYFDTGTSGNPNDNGARAVGDAERQDNYFYLQPSLDIRIRDRWSASIFYTRRQNVSRNSSSTGFDNNQVGIRTTIEF